MAEEAEALSGAATGTQPVRVGAGTRCSALCAEPHRVLRVGAMDTVTLKALPWSSGAGCWQGDTET